jgi:hypothetical protein
LISEKISLSDIDGDLLSNPFNGVLQVKDLETDNYFSLNAELQKLDNFEASNGSDTNILGRVRVPEISSGRIYDPTIATYIELDGATVEVSANDLTVNGVPVLTTTGTTATLPVGDLQTTTVSSLNNELSKISNFSQAINGVTIISGGLRVQGAPVLTNQGGINIGLTFDVNQTQFDNPQSLVTKKYVDDNSGGGSGGTFQEGNLAIRPTNQGSVAGNGRGANALDLQTIRANSSQVASGISSAILYGRNNAALATGSCCGGDGNVSTNDFTAVFGQNNRCSGPHTFMTGFNNNMSARFSLVGGENSTITLDKSLLVGNAHIGDANFSIIGGDSNSVNGNFCNVVGENITINSSNYCSAFGKDHNIGGCFNSSVVGYGHNLNGLAVSSVVSGFVNNLSAGFSSIVGHTNTLTGAYSAVSGLDNNTSSAYSTYSGQQNTGSGSHCQVSGQENSVSGTHSQVSGFKNFVNAPHTIVSGRNNNINSTGGNSVCLGSSNFVSGFSGVCLGENNTCTGNNSVALGYGAGAINNGSFVFCDSSSEDTYGSTVDNTFNIRCSGGMNLATMNSDSKIDFKINGVSKGSINYPVTGKDGLVISTSQDIRLFSKFGKINTNCNINLGSYDYNYPNVNFRSGSTLANGSNQNSTYGHSFTPRVGITINTLLIPSNLFNNSQGSSRDVSIWENGVLVLTTTFFTKFPILDGNVNGFYRSELTVPFVCTSGNEYIIGCRVQFGDNIDDSNINNSAVIVGSNVTDLDDLFSNVVGLYNITSNSGTLLPDTPTVGITPFIQFNFSTNGVGRDLKSQNITCDKLTVGNPIVERESKIISHIDYSNLYPYLMVADLDGNTGGVNKCWGHTATYVAGVQLMAGRVVSLKKAIASSDNIRKLEVEYLRVNLDENQPTIYPIGITQHNANANEPIIVCVLGYTTAILQSGDSTPERGSIVLSDSSNTGKIRTSVQASNNQGRIGFCAQSNNGGGNSTMLIYYSGYFQPY